MNNVIHSVNHVTFKQQIARTFAASKYYHNYSIIEFNMKNLIRFIAILFTAITLSALMAHLLELRVKINLSKEDYQIVQGIYSGWQWLGIFEIGAIILTIIWIIFDRKLKNIFPFLLTSLICFILSIFVFFIFTFPTNQETLNWTSLPNHWDELRKTWEYSHATRAILSLFGFSFLILALLKNTIGRQ